VKRLPGGQPGNQSAVKHGLRMALNTVPKGCARVRIERDRLRSVLEQSVLELHGQITPYHAAVIQTACRWATHAALAARWLRLELDELSAAERLSYSREVARASSERDRCLERLGLDKDQRETILDVLFTRQRPQDAVSRDPGDEGSDTPAGDEAAGEKQPAAVEKQPGVREGNGDGS